MAHVYYSSTNATGARTELHTYRIYKKSEIPTEYLLRTRNNIICILNCYIIWCINIGTTDTFIIPIAAVFRGGALKINYIEQSSLMLTDTIKNNKILPVKGIEINTNANLVCYAQLLFVAMQLQLIARIAYNSKYTKEKFNLIITFHSELDLTNATINETLNYKTLLFRHRLPLPNTHYELKLINNKHENQQLKMLIQHTGQLHTNTIENANVFVDGKVSLHKSIENSADAKIYAVNCHTMSAEVIPANIYIQCEDKMNWYLRYNEQYLIRLTLFYLRYWINI